MVFADPPFNIGYKCDKYHDDKASSKYLAWMRDWIGACVGVLKPHGSFSIATGEWIRACHGGEQASCNFDVGGLLAEVVLLGNIALRRSKKLSWDAAHMKSTNDEEANRYVKEPYRDGRRL